jgi:hypothetical protein
VPVGSLSRICGRRASPVGPAGVVAGEVEAEAGLLDVGQLGQFVGGVDIGRLGDDGGRLVLLLLVGDERGRSW